MTAGMVKVAGTMFSFGTLDEWRRLHYGRLVHARASRQEYGRQHRIFMALRPETIRRSFDVDGLRRLNDYLRADIGVGFVRFDAGAHRGNTWRGHLTALRMAAHNRLHQLESGSAFRDRVRHGPVDPGRMPDRALDRVIQTCRDMCLVERCRSERQRRAGRRAAA